MKVGILTWHKALNHGAVLQAYASQNVIKGMNETPIILDYRRKVAKPSLIYKIKTFVRYLSNNMFSYRHCWKTFDLQKEQIFEEFRQKYLLLGKMYSEEKMDVAMVGSDMVFSLDQGYNPYMFGYGVNCNKLFSYAACAGGTSYGLTVKKGVCDEIRKGLDRFSSIGCRDIETIALVKQLVTNKSILENIDPVLLYGFENEKNAWDSGKWENHSKYLLVYSYHSHMDGKRETSAIIKYARNNGLKIVSCGYYHPWCDENINASPCEFIEMFKHASCIVTDTFHGTVFSIVMKKNFVSIIRGNGYKLKDLLCKCHLENRIVNNFDQDINPGLMVDYSYYDKWIQEQRSLCIDYLKKCLS